jgi:hypothetical protein
VSGLLPLAVIESLRAEKYASADKTAYDVYEQAFMDGIVLSGMSVAI